MLYYVHIHFNQGFLVSQKHALLQALDIPVWLTRHPVKVSEKSHEPLKVIGKPFSDRAEMLFSAMLEIISLKRSEILFVHHENNSDDKLEISVAGGLPTLMIYHPDYLLHNRTKKAEAYQNLLTLQNLINQSKLAV